MNVIALYGLVAVALVSTTSARAELRPSLREGDTYEITKVRDSSNRGTNGSSGSSHDQDTLIERIEAMRPDGLEVVFDLPNDAPADERRQEWQFPVRLFEPLEGTARLLNAPELEKRVDAWLKWGKMTREACGHWIFTWNTFRIECDPQSVIATIQAFDPKLPELHDGALYRDVKALHPAKLTMKNQGSNGSTFTANLVIDPRAVQRDRAEADVVVAEISHKPVTLEAALAQRANEAVSGTTNVTIDADAAGNWRRVTKVTKIQTKKPDGSAGTETVTETLERRLISSTKP